MNHERPVLKARAILRRWTWLLLFSILAVPHASLGQEPPDTFHYRLGNRSALDWVIDQYQVYEDARSGIRSDPNRADDPEYIVRLVGQVVRVSIETMKLVDSLPADFGAGVAGDEVTG